MITYELNILIFVTSIILVIVLLIVGYLIMRKFVSAMSKFVEQRLHRVLTILKCPVCGYTVTREYKFGDYIGMIDNEVCPYGHGRLIVTSIYREVSHEKST